VFEGPRERVESMLAWCEQGPRGSVVSGTEVEWEQPAGEAGFDVR
jgi:acylphosphatase